MTADINELTTRDNLDQLWQTVLGELEVVLSKANFTTWFKGTFIDEISDGELIVAVPNNFNRRWIADKFHKDILAAIIKLKPDIKRITYNVSARRPQPVVLLENSPSTPKARHQTVSTRFAINSLYTLKNFVVGKTNQLAHAAAVAVAQKPGGRTHNPLFIYGGVGLGKTHLAQAIGNEILERARKTKVVYVSCETFTNDFIAAISAGKMREFKKTYRDVDILLVDDIQFLSNKEGSQEEFFHTFNSLHQSNRQIVITADRPPKAIPGVAERLSSRFGSGMVADIQPPNYEVRLAILQAKAQEREITAPMQVFEYIAQTIRSNIRELEGALTRLVAYCEMENQPPTLAVAKSALDEALITPRIANLNPDRIIEVISKHFGIQQADLLGARRQKELVRPRQILMYLLRHELNHSFPKIGRELGGKDHTTIIHGCEKIEKELARDTDLKDEMAIIKEQVYAS